MPESPAEDPFRPMREAMVETQIRRRGVRNPGVLSAMREVPRHLFVPPSFRKEAYADHAVPLGRGQTVSQPYVVALMAERLDPKPHMRVLEVGLGSGYFAAVLSRLVAEVYGIERDPVLAEEARARLQDLGILNVRVRTGDGTLGWKEEAPFDAVAVTAGAPRVPAALAAQMRPGAVMVVPVGGRDEQVLLKCVRRPDGTFDCCEEGAVRFVPLVGRQGWGEEKPEKRK